MVAGVGARLVRVRGKAPQREFAELLGVHVNTYARWERNEAECGVSALARLYQLGINPTWVVTGEGLMKVADASAVAEAAPDKASQVVRPGEGISADLIERAAAMADETLRRYGARDRVSGSDFGYVVRMLAFDLQRGLAADQAQGHLAALLGSGEPKAET